MSKEAVLSPMAVFLSLVIVTTVTFEGCIKSTANHGSGSLVVVQDTRMLDGGARQWQYHCQGSGSLVVVQDTVAVSLSIANAATLFKFVVI